MKFASFSAGIHASWKICEKRAVKLPSGKRRIEKLWIHAGQNGTQTAVNHVTGKPVRRDAPEWKEWRQSCACEPLLAVAPHIFEKQISKGDMRKALRHRFPDCR